MATRILLVRHGATVLSREDFYCGATNVELSDVGRQQAAALSRRLSGEKIAAAYCSHMNRAIDTATIIAKPHNLTPIQKPALCEIDHGRWEGKRRSEVEKEFGEEYALWENDPFVFAPQGGESGLSVLARSLPVMREIVSAHPGKTVLIVSHKATIRLLIGSLLGFDTRGYRDRLDQNPACLNVLDFKDPSKARLTLFNDISHYAAYPGQPTGRLSKWWDDDPKAK
jgi:broad specificity phosphatase PhoE